MVDISEWLDFEFYDICHYWDVPNSENNPKIRRWLGVSHQVGSAMSYWILTETVKVISRTTVQHLASTESDRPHIVQQVNDFHQELDKKLGDDQYVDTSDDFESFINEDVPEIEGKIRNEDPYHV